MSNTNPDPRQPQGAAGQPYASPYTQDAAPQPQQPAPKPENRFFQWIRESRVMRTNDRVIAGVCGGIARTLGWNVTLVRVLMVIAVFFGGFGAILYALGWFLLPDEMTGTILCEEIFEGRWDWAFIGVILCVLIGGFVWEPWLPFGTGGLLAILFAMLAMYLLVDNGRRRFLAQPPMPGPGNSPSGGPAQPPRTPMGQPSVRPTSYAQNAAPATAVPRPAAAAQPAPPYPAGAPQAAAPRPAVTPQAAAMPHTAAAAPRPAPQPRAARRPGAGAPLVLLVLGLVIASCAILSLYDRHFAITGTLQPTILYVGGVTAILGVIIIVLGIRGHRTGGLHPFAWIAMVVALCMVAVGTAYSTLMHVSMNPGDSYTRIVLDGPATIGSTKADMTKLANGIAVEGHDYDKDILTIDLTDYAKHHQAHRVALNDGSDGMSNCPAGDVNIVATRAQVRVVLPQGCSWGEATDDGVMTTGDTFIGGKHSVISGFNPFSSDFALIRVNTDSGERVDVSIPPFLSVHTGGNDEFDDAFFDDDFFDDDEDYIDAEDYLDDDTLSRFCRGVRVDDNGEVSFTSKAGDSARKLIKDGDYWPCAITANEAVAQPELVVAPNVLVGASVSIQYEGINDK